MTLEEGLHESVLGEWPGHSFLMQLRSLEARPATLLCLKLCFTPARRWLTPVNLPLRTSPACGGGQIDTPPQAGKVGEG
jgi:hypothetical protein